MNKDRMILCGKSDMGRQRTNNEDAYVAEELDKNTILAVAIDGVGGYEGGEVAAEIARKEISEYMKEFKNGERLELLKQAVICANNAIYERRKVDSARPNMSCVLTASLIDKDRRVVDMVHVGDTRMYQFRQGVLTKLSHDHSLIGYREEMGDLTEEEAMHHPQRNVISRDVGSAIHEVGDSDFLEFGEFPLLPNSIFLLCSDGLTDLVTSKQIVSILEQQTTLDRKAQMLIDAANDAGGKDNVTVVLVGYEKEEDDDKAQVSKGPCNGPETVVAETAGLDDDNFNENTGSQSNQINGKKKRLKVAILSACILAVLACAVFCCRFFDERVVRNNPQTDISLVEQSNIYSKDGFMYDLNTSHPWSSYLSVDSNYVLRLEQLQEDSLGRAYRAIVYRRDLWEDGSLVCRPLESPRYIGYGTNVSTMDSVEFFFQSGYLGDFSSSLFLYGKSLQDSVIYATSIPFESEVEGAVQFVKYAWDDLTQWWVNPMCDQQ